ncbi:MAG TPA: hypothetical protein VF062_22515, partial [Candidatus Limnocylindrales bacterium]
RRVAAARAAPRPADDDHPGDGTQATASGFGDPQAMRMILLQILTGRRASEIRTCEADCIESVTDAAASAADGQEIARFRYAQSKIDIAPDSILVDRDVTAIIEEQRRWARDRFPDAALRQLFVRSLGNRLGAKVYPPGTYTFRLRQFSDLLQITDSKGRPVRLSHTHRFRHTKLTRGCSTLRWPHCSLLIWPHLGLDVVRV